MEAINHRDVLPVHQSTKCLEFLTSYLIRLVQENRIASVAGITALCFPYQDRRIARDFADYPPASFEIVEASGVNKVALPETTFFHIGVKFGRTPKPQLLSRFLAGSVAPCLRYCPYCLTMQHHPYYSLLWRFFDIRCCTIYHSELLDRCGHCDAKVPLLAAPLKIGICPLCKSDLRMCRPKSSSEAELSETLILSQNIEFLLSPLISDEMNLTSVAQCLGLRFKYERKAQGVAALEATQRVGVTPDVIEGIERGNVWGRGVKFQSYLSTRSI